MIQASLGRIRDALLEQSSAYQLQQWVFGAHHCHRYFVDTHVRPARQMRLLDLGCGPGTTASHLPDETLYVGVDISPKYVDQAQKRLQSERHFLAGSNVLCADVASVNWQNYEPFDIAIAFGLLHHLSDEIAQSMLATVSKLLAPDGRIVCIDPVFTNPQQWLDRWLVSMDRGRHVRTPEQMKKLFPDGALETKVYRDLLRFPYSQIVTSWSRR